jgi:hypothetical protein
MCNKKRETAILRAYRSNFILAQAMNEPEVVGVQVSSLLSEVTSKTLRDKHSVL